jgi:hypothetical protein
MHFAYTQYVYYLNGCEHAYEHPAKSMHPVDMHFEYVFELNMPIYTHL